jgi:hypothetical protein
MNERDFVYLEDTIREVIEVTEASPGPKGDPGEAGTGAFVYEQVAPASVWNIEHNLGFFPGVTVVDSSGTDVVGSITYIDEDNLYVTFHSPFGGTAYLS